MLKCQHCGAQLTAPPERDRGEWIIRCFACGVTSIIQPTLEIIGYRGNHLETTAEIFLFLLVPS
jgi:hypothetical protein